MLEGREALSLSGHTHTIENHAPGQLFEGWTKNTAAAKIYRSQKHASMRTELPALPIGVHLIEVESTDRHGHSTSDTITIEVVEQRPPRYWRHDLWDE